ncbi:peptidase M50 family protein, partial [Chlamydia psittaci 02DC22]
FILNLGLAFIPMIF